jgi:hypothetical protein
MYEVVGHANRGRPYRIILYCIVGTLALLMRFGARNLGRICDWQEAVVDRYGHHLEGF